MKAISIIQDEHRSITAVIEGLRQGDGPPPSAAAMRWLWHRYRGEAHFLDTHLGRLLAAWRTRFSSSQAARKAPVKVSYVARPARLMTVFSVL